MIKERFLRNCLVHEEIDVFVIEKGKTILEFNDNNKLVEGFHISHRRNNALKHF